MTTEESIRQLNSFLRGEISSVETYRQALEKVKDATARVELERCYQSHKDRVALLQSHIRGLGGVPDESSGPWGGFAKLIQGTAKIFGEGAAIAALEEGEDHGLNDYRADLPDLAPETKALVEDKLLPAQMETHATVSALKKRFKKSA
jgi:uncharacterized protein (TIGR02284 family)